MHLNDNFQTDVAAIQGIAAVSHILDVACRMTGMGFAAVARVTEDRWVACQLIDTVDFGLQPGGELKIETTICQEVRARQEPVVINHVAENEYYAGHLVPAMYGFQSYISMPIILPDGRFFGTLCAIDPRPACVDTPEIIGMFKLFAELIGFHLSAQETLAASAADLTDERETAEIREQVIAVLGHDLRNPLSAISAGAALLMRLNLEHKAAEIVKLMLGTAARMNRLVENMLDFARGRLGDGVQLQLESGRSLETTLQQVISELTTIYPGRVIDSRWSITMPVTCDHARIAQLFSNLLGNALDHGAADAPVEVEASTNSGGLELSLTNSGDPIPPSDIERIFQPFKRDRSRTKREGLGLGLFIAAEIARAHGGSLAVSSTPEKTRFNFIMPLK